MIYWVLVEHGWLVVSIRFRADKKENGENWGKERQTVKGKRSRLKEIDRQLDR